jgi:hypothetical protein
LTLLPLTSGCWGRAIREGIGAVKGASGSFVQLSSPGSLSGYNGLRVEPVQPVAGLLLPSQFESILKTSLFEQPAEALLISSGGSPLLVARCEVIHYEDGDVVDQAIGPLKEVILRVVLHDGDSDAVLGMANVVGRSKATSSSGRHTLGDGAGKGLRKWLEATGVRERPTE